jgi:hypothetical protein
MEGIRRLFPELQADFTEHKKCPHVQLSFKSSMTDLRQVRRYLAYLVVAYGSITPPPAFSTRHCSY